MKEQTTHLGWFLEYMNEKLFLICLFSLINIERFRVNGGTDELWYGHLNASSIYT